MQKNYTLNILLAAVVGLASLAALLCRVFLPAAILPVVSLPAVAALVLIALVLECYLTKPIPQRDWGVTGLLGALIFGLLPFGAGLTAGGEAVRLAVPGGWPRWSPAASCSWPASALSAWCCKPHTILVNSKQIEAGQAARPLLFLRRMPF